MAQDLGFQKGSQAEGTRLDKFPKGWLDGRQIPLEGRIPMALLIITGSPLWEGKVTVLHVVAQCVIL